MELSENYFVNEIHSAYRIFSNLNCEDKIKYYNHNGHCVNGRNYFVNNVDGAANNTVEQHFGGKNYFIDNIDGAANNAIEQHFGNLLDSLNTTICYDHTEIKKNFINDISFSVTYNPIEQNYFGLHKMKDYFWNNIISSDEAIFDKLLAGRLPIKEENQKSKKNMKSIMKEKIIENLKKENIKLIRKIKHLEKILQIVLIQQMKQKKYLMEIVDSMKVIENNLI